MAFFLKPEAWPVTEYWIETGTGHGDGIGRALALGYPRILSADVSEELVAAAAQRFPTATVYQWSSPTFLGAKLRPEMDATLWLDAHYSGAGPWEGFDPDFGQCPLLAELDALSRVPWDRPPYVAIDDVFMFDGSAVRGERPEIFNPVGFAAGHWPTLEQIMEKLPGYLFVKDDFTLFCTPAQR